jgi:predicted negative regulator of RcsB-dependent stress response
MANTNWQPFFLRVLLIVAAGFWIFSPALHGDWLMDDDMYLTQNVLLHDPARLWKIWFLPGSLIEYYPIEASLQAVQWHFWHLDTLGYHLTNLFLHTFSALLVWRLLSKFGLRLAWLGGFLFMVHPAVVESVAWISELKNTLSLPPFLLAMCFWIDYEERGRSRDYFLALGLFLIAMLCKISMALFPVVMLLYAWWKRGRLSWRDVVKAMPFLAISLVLGLTTIFVGHAYQHSHLQSTDDPAIGGLLTHVALAGQSLSFYFSKCVWPVEMIPIYPKWLINTNSPLTYLPWPVMAIVIYWLWCRRETWGRHALLGLGFFVINLLPFIGFNSVSYMGFTWVMDHFLYLPLIGLVGLATAALEDLEGRVSQGRRPYFAAITAIVLALLAFESQSYAERFAGPERLWTYTIARNPASWLAHNNLGNVLLETGRPAEAIIQYEESLQFNPRGAEANNNLGLALAQEGRTGEAIDHYEVALKTNPHFALAHANLANALVREGRLSEAMDHYEQALRVDPHNLDARVNLTRLKAQQKTPLR